MIQATISRREQEVLNLIAYEHSTKMIAQELYISEHTVMSHRKNLLAKLEVKNTAGLVRRAFEVGLMQIGQVAIVIIMLLSVHIPQSGLTQCNESDFGTFKTIYDEINISVWTNNTGWSVFAANATCPTGFDLGSLHGVTLNASGRVQALNLSNNNLIGVLPNEFNGLEELMALNLSKNKLSGNIPTTIGEIETLEVLQLQENNLNGTTGFTGAIPITGDNFPSLKTLRLNKNSLTGGIPEHIGLLKTLEEIGIHNNSLGGSLPQSIGYLPNLTNLKLFNNGITGCLPPSYYTLCDQLTNANIDNGNTLDASWADFCNSGTGACDRPFVTTWKTDNLGINTPCTTCVVIPTIGGGYMYDIDWDGDDIYEETSVTGDATHDYEVAGTYQVKIRGNFPRIYFSGTPENNKILSIDQWGDVRWTSMELAFHTCSNVQVLATDAPILTDATNMSGMFSNASSINADLSHWNVSKVTNMFGTFFNASSFDQELSDWDISAVTTMESMLDQTAINTSNYDVTLISWSKQNVQPSVTLGVQGLTYCDATPARGLLINDNGWVIEGDTEDPNCFRPFITTWVTDNPGSSPCTTCITIPTVSGLGYSYDVDWTNDGIFDTLNVTGSITHDYLTEGTHQIAIRGSFPRIRSADSANPDKLLSVDQWGNIAWSSMADAFSGCSNLVVSATDSPDLSLVMDMSNMFKDCKSLNQDISDWNISSVTDLSGMFDGASVFNQDLSDWNVTNVQNMSEMFSDAHSFNSPLNWSNKVYNTIYMSEMFANAFAFNQDISGWGVDNVIDMSGMFSRALVFNQDIGGWDVDSVTDMSSMFNGADAFNQEINGWNVGNVNDMSDMFSRALVFNQDLSDWDVSEVIDMGNMFAYTIAFNQDLSDWNVSSVENMSRMFIHARNFDGPLDWESTTSNVIDMTEMFSYTASFNQNLSNWDVSRVINMSSMFHSSSSFNQDLSDWNVSSVKDMESMFLSSNKFNQSLCDWNIVSVENMANMFGNSVMSTYNYDQTLIGWAEKNVQDDVHLGASTPYCSSESARQELIADHNWEIDDAGIANSLNQWSGPLNTIMLWHSSRFNWDLDYLPSFCNDIEIPTDAIVEISSNHEGHGQTLEIQLGAEFSVELGGILEIDPNK